MQHTVADFLRPSLVPELGSDIAAGTACNRHLVLVTVAAVRALSLIHISLIASFYSGLSSDIRNIKWLKY